MKSCILVLLILSGKPLLFSQSNYSVSGIPPELRVKANAVLRLYELKFEVLNKGEALETEHKVITLLNDKASDENDLYVWYDQIRKIKDIEGAVFDANGKLVRKIKNSDITDLKAFEDVFVTDNRFKKVKFPSFSYPYTIEYTVVTRHNGLLHYPVFEPQQNPAYSVELAKFEIVAADSLKVRCKEFNVQSGQKTAALSWVFKNMPAFEPEPFLPLGFTGLPRIMTAPTAFSIEGYEGDMSTWSSLGKFIQQMNAGKTSLDPATEARLQALTADCPDPICKARRVYEYLQNNTRYYFVGMGIGGWQPMLAKDVDKFKYSDCKGLSNYTIAMLHTVGVPAYYALIRATESEQQSQVPDFPNAWFNHATLCIPLPGDTIWLECTSQQESFGFLSTFTDDRLAFVVYPEGGKILHTPRYGVEENTIRRQVKVLLNPDGSAKLQSTGTFRGISQISLAWLAETSEERRQTTYYKHLDINNFEIEKLSLERKKERIPEVVQTLSLKLPNLASVSGKRLFLPGRYLSEKINLPLVESPRKHPIQADSRGYTEEDHIYFSIPSGYRLENEVPSIAIDNEFGHFELSAQASSDTLQVHRKLILNNTIQPKEKYDVLISLLKTIAKADQMKWVLVHD